jgi:hypothetical protein
VAVAVQRFRECVHIYRLTIDGVELNDTASEAFWDAGGIVRSGMGPRGGAGAPRPIGAPGQPPAQAGGAGNRSAGPGASAGPNFWDAFCKAMNSDVIPMIDARYRTLTDREHRAIAGLSLGGARTLQITQDHIDKFAYIGPWLGLLRRYGRGGHALSP